MDCWVFQAATNGERVSGSRAWLFIKKVIVRSRWGDIQKALNVGLGVHTGLLGCVDQ